MPRPRAIWLLPMVRQLTAKFWLMLIGGSSSDCASSPLSHDLAMSAAVGQSDAMQLSAGASAPCVEALYRFRLPTPTEAGRSPLTGGPNSASLLPTGRALQVRSLQPQRQKRWAP